MDLKPSFVRGMAYYGTQKERVRPVDELPDWEAEVFLDDHKVRFCLPCSLAFDFALLLQVLFLFPVRVMLPVLLLLLLLLLPPRRRCRSHYAQ